MNFKVKVNMRTMDIINATTASQSIKDCKDDIIVTGLAIVEDGGTNADHETCDVGYIASDHGVFGFVSSVMLRNLPLLADYLKECLDAGEICKIRFISGKTKDENEFYSFVITE